MSTKRRRHSPEQIVKKLRDADAMLNAGKDLAAELQTVEVSESTLDRWRKQYGMKSEEAVRLKNLEEENKRYKQLDADQALDIQALKFVAAMAKAILSRNRRLLLPHSHRPGNAGEKCEGQPFNSGMATTTEPRVVPIRISS